MSRFGRAKIDPVGLLATPQLDLFPVAPIVEVLEPRVVVGERTAVEHLLRVRVHATDAAHMIFHDRHGWYCEQHGPQCPAVALAQRHGPP